MKHLLILLLIPAISFSQMDDIDKHYWAGFAISTTVTIIATQTKAKHPPAIGLIASLLVGVGKELIDHHKHNIPFKNEGNDQYYDHISDAFYTGSGGMTATITMFIILKHRDRKKEKDYMTPQ